MSESHSERHTMVPLLLLLLLPDALADQVCLNISNGYINITGMEAKITDERSGYVKCTMGGYPCYFECTVSNKTWFNGSSVCLEANVRKDLTNIVYSLQQHTTCTIYLCQDNTILPLINLLDNSNSYQKQLMQLFYMRDSCVQLFHSNHEVKKAFINAEREIIHNIMAMSQLEPGSSVSYSLKALSLNVVNISETHLSCAGTNSSIQIEVPQLLPQNQSFVPEIWLPVDSLCTIPKQKRIIGVVNYMSHSHFQFKQENISSVVIRIEILGKNRLHDLKTSIKMVFNVADHTDMGNDSLLQCHYFDEHDWHWKTDGCETSNRTSNYQTDIICNCNHATAFAVLLIRQPIAKIHWEILSYISYIGCGLSAFFSALSLVIYVFSRNHRLDYSTSIHVSLSGALFLLNSTFLLTEWGATMKLDWVCVFVAALMHYSLLCCFTWMAIEALHLYLLLIKVFNTNYKYYLVKLSLAGWGIPGIIVGVSLAVKDFKQFYGVTQLIMAETNQTTAICWITDDSFFYSLNLVYFTLIFVFNSGILMAVASSICKMKQVFRSNSRASAGAEGKTCRDPGMFTESCRSGLTVLGLTCLMGSTWGLAFLGSGYTNYPILYLFCILNSIQGFFIFLWICLSAKKQKKRDMEDRMTSTAVKTSGIKSD